MATFVEFRKSGGGPVAINPDLVVLATPAGDNPNSVVIQTADGQTLHVEGKFADVVGQLRSAAGPPAPPPAAPPPPAWLRRPGQA